MTLCRIAAGVVAIPILVALVALALSCVGVGLIIARDAFLGQPKR